MSSYVDGLMQLDGTQDNSEALPPPYNCSVFGIGDDTLFGTISKP